MKAKQGDVYRWCSALRSHVGKVRQVNEDSVLARPDIGVWAVADGLGGHHSGDTASRMVVDALAALSPAADLSRLLSVARRKLIAVNDEINEAMHDQHAATPGSTVAALLVIGSAGAVLWAGDSRVYLLRDGKLRRLSRDHSQAEELVQSGLLSRDEVIGHPSSSILTRAVGANDGLELEDAVIDVFPGDCFLLCSDGLYNEVSEPTMERVLTDNDCDAAAEALLQLALAGEARDNISVVTVRGEPGAGASPDETAINPVFRHPPAKGGT